MGDMLRVNLIEGRDFLYGLSGFEDLIVMLFESVKAVGIETTDLEYFGLEILFLGPFIVGGSEPHSTWPICCSKRSWV